jgi:hypothetical protein
MLFENIMGRVRKAKEERKKTEKFPFILKEEFELEVKDTSKKNFRSNDV